MPFSIPISRLLLIMPCLMLNFTQMSSRKHGSMPVPASILLRVRELAEMHAQVPPNLSTNKLLPGCGGRATTATVHETRAGFL